MSKMHNFPLKLLKLIDMRHCPFVWKENIALGILFQHIQTTRRNHGED